MKLNCIERYYLQQLLTQLDNIAEFPPCIYGAGNIGFAVWESLRESRGLKVPIIDSHPFLLSNEDNKPIKNKSWLLNYTDRLSVIVTPRSGHLSLVNLLKEQTHHQILGYQLSLSTIVSAGDEKMDFDELFRHLKQNPDQIALWERVIQESSDAAQTISNLWSTVKNSSEFK